LLCHSSIFSRVGASGKPGAVQNDGGTLAFASVLDPAYVVSLNLHRRHLAESQRAKVAAKLATLGRGQRADRVEGSIDLSTAANLLNVSERSVKSARAFGLTNVSALQTLLYKCGSPGTKMLGASRMLSLINIRLSTRADSAALAALHRDAWHYAYRGIIPGVSLEKIIARRGLAWWERMRESGPRALVLEFDKRVVGYATFGPCRTRGLARRGEIHELYLRPEFQGVGFGRRLFDEARCQLRAHDFVGLVVWSLAENDLACRFYKALGGKERMRGYERIGGIRLEMIAFDWPRPR